jgi:transcriptional regulator of acetoin/glycerol metabolism
MAKNNKIENKQNNTLSEFINKHKEKPAKELSILVANKFPKTPKKVLADALDISRNTFYRHIKK